MYSTAIIKANEETANRLLQKRFGKGFTLERHSIDLVDSRTRQLEAFPDDELRNPKDPEVARWIANERHLCRIDYNYWATHYGYIKNRQSQIVRYSPNKAQLIFHDITAQMESDGLEIILQFLKARKLGISTESQLRILHRILYFINSSFIIGSDQPEDTDKLSQMLTLAYERQPKWMKPEITRFSSGVYYEYSNGNRLDLHHGKQKTDIGRGETPRGFHLSELVKYENAESLIDAGLLMAVVPDPQVFGVLEGTAEGDTGWWHDTYWYNKRYYGKSGTSARMRPTFLPWFVGTELYPSETWLRSNQWDSIKSTWTPKPETQMEADRAKDYVRSSPLLVRHLGAEWEMSREQMYFYECSVNEYKAKNRLHVWLSEMASDDLSCFVSRQMSIFDAELRLRYRHACALPKAVFALKGESIPQKFWPLAQDIVGPSIKVRSDWTLARSPLDFEFVPIRFSGYQETDPYLKLFVWEWPDGADTYAVGCDPSDGLGERQSDNTVIEVFRKGNQHKLDSQVAEFVSPDISGTDVWPWLLAISTFFSGHYENEQWSAGKAQCRVVPEINRGREIVKQMEFRGWHNFHATVQRRATERGTPNVVLGWYTTAQNREDLVELGVRSLREEYLEINSPWFVSEMDTFIKHPNGRKEHSDGKHDDRLFALFIAFASMYYDEERSTGKSPFVERQRATLPEVQYPLYRDEHAYDRQPSSEDVVYR